MNHRSDAATRADFSLVAHDIIERQFAPSLNEYYDKIRADAHRRGAFVPSSSLQRARHAPLNLVVWAPDESSTTIRQWQRPSTGFEQPLGFALQGSEAEAVVKLTLSRQLFIITVYRVWHFVRCVRPRWRENSQRHT